MGPQVSWFVSRDPLNLAHLSRDLWPTVIVLLAGLGVSEEWFPHVNVAAWVLDGYHYYVEPPISCQTLVSKATDCSGRRTVTKTDAAAYLGVFLVLAVALSALSFRRRDVP